MHPNRVPPTSASMLSRHKTITRSYLWTGVILIIEHSLLHLTVKSIVAPPDETQSVQRLGSAAAPLQSGASRGRARGEREVEAVRPQPDLCVPSHTLCPVTSYHHIIFTHQTLIREEYWSPETFIDFHTFTFNTIV